MGVASRAQPNSLRLAMIEIGDRRVEIGYQRRIDTVWQPSHRDRRVKQSHSATDWAAVLRLRGTSYRRTTRKTERFSYKGEWANV